MFNHVGRSFPAFRAAAGGPGSPAARWFKRTDGGDDYAVFEGHGQLVEFDHDEPAVLAYVIEVMSHWLGRGAGGWRLDAAYAVPRVLLGQGGAGGADGVSRRLVPGRDDSR